jgi:polysaccharide export outer membrane protein
MKDKLFLQHILRIIILGIFLSGCAATSVSPPAPLPAPTNSTRPVVVTETTKDDYIMGPEDVIEIAVWKEPDVSRVVSIRPDGKISLPLTGDIQAAGLTAEQLKGKIREALAGYMDEPNVSVTVQGINSLKIFIQGEVAAPGVYQLRSNCNILQAISLAKGFTEWAKKDRIVVFRKEGDKALSIPVNYEKILSGEDPAQNIILQRDDTIVVP